MTESAVLTAEESHADYLASCSVGNEAIRAQRSTPTVFLDGKVSLYRGDCLAILPMLEADSIDACVSDPPYHLTSIVKRFGADNAAAAAPGVYGRSSSGFMGKKWDCGDVAFRPETWAEVLRVLKPGAHLVAFGAPKNYHRLACAIEDAGFEIRDSIFWAFGSGFPKSHNLSGKHEGWGTALKPAYEPIILARKPLSGTVAATVSAHGTGAININGCRVGTDGGTTRSGQAPYGNSGWRTGHKIVELNSGRWPANIIHDGSEEVLAAFPESDGAQGNVRGTEPSQCHSGVYSGPRDRQAFEVRGDSGSAARFFYTAKADASDRIGSKHPTVKPIDLMRWLCRLITPPGGTILDPFAGTGTTAEAAFYEGFRAVLIEREDEYCTDIARRMEACLAGPDERSRLAAKARPQVDAGPLFGGTDHAGGGARFTESSRTNNRSDGVEVVNDYGGFS